MLAIHTGYRRSEVSVITRYGYAQDTVPPRTYSIRVRLCADVMTGSAGRHKEQAGGIRYSTVQYGTVSTLTNRASPQPSARSGNSVGPMDNGHQRQLSDRPGIPGFRG
jgi:hypothetical protein